MSFPEKVRREIPVEIRQCRPDEIPLICDIINDGAQAYRDVIPPDRWHDPYMKEEALRREIELGVEFWGCEETGNLTGVMGIQYFPDVTLIRHAYVRTVKRNRGVGTQLLNFLLDRTELPVLIGTWADAEWAVRFYRKHGFELVSWQEKERLLRRYWTIPERQIETSVVLADANWFRSVSGGRE